MSINRNKRSLAVDMKQAEGRAVLERLIARADVLVQSLRAGVVREDGQHQRPPAAVALLVAPVPVT